MVDFDRKPASNDKRTQSENDPLLELMKLFGNPSEYDAPDEVHDYGTLQADFSEESDHYRGGHYEAEIDESALDYQTQSRITGTFPSFADMYSEQEEYQQPHQHSYEAAEEFTLSAGNYEQNHEGNYEGNYEENAHDSSFFATPPFHMEELDPEQEWYGHPFHAEDSVASSHRENSEAIGWNSETFHLWSDGESRSPEAFSPERYYAETETYEPNYDPRSEEFYSSNRAEHEDQNFESPNQGYSYENDADYLNFIEEQEEKTQSPYSINHETQPTSDEEDVHNAFFAEMDSSILDEFRVQETESFALPEADQFVNEIRSYEYTDETDDFIQNQDVFFSQASNKVDFYEEAELRDDNPSSFERERLEQDVVYDWMPDSALTAPLAIEPVAHKSFNHYKWFYAVAALIGFMILGGVLYYFSLFPFSQKQTGLVIIHADKEAVKTKPKVADTVTNHMPAVYDRVSGIPMTEPKQEALIDENVSIAKVSPEQERPPLATETVLDHTTIEQLVNEASAQALPLHSVPAVSVSRDGKVSALEDFSGSENQDSLSDASSSSTIMPKFIPEKPANSDVIRTVIGDSREATDQNKESALFYVQIASQPSKELAQQSIDEASKRLAPYLDSSKITIVPATIPERGTYYRVRILVNGQEEAIRLCDYYKKTGGNCFIGR